MTTSKSRRLISLSAIALLTACVQEASPQASGGADAGSEPAADVEPEFVDGELQPLPDGFPDMPITLVSVDEAGSLDGVYARTLDEALNGISPVDIIVSDEPRAEGGTVNTLADVKTRDGGLEGYFPVITSIGGTATDWHVAPLEEETGVGIDDVNFFISTENYPWVVMTRTDAPWGASFAEFVEYGRENPGELRYIPGGVGSGTDIAGEWLLANLGIEVNKIPAADRQAAAAIIGSGEGDFTMTQPEVAATTTQTGRAEVIFATSQDVPEEWADNPDFGTAADYEEYGIPEATWGTVLGFMLPVEVPESHAQWLFALFEAAMETDIYQQRGETQAGINIELLSTEEANQLADTLYEESEPIIRDIGLHFEDN
ncbi:MAG: hypothetical protein GEU73_09680 [Chloroflexi bacterium]|nr:hypothetical protein [Chloroflexota bacterium]